MERLITIEGERRKTTQAARAMLIKLRASYDRDVEHIKVCNSFFPSNFSASRFPKRSANCLLKVDKITRGYFVFILTSELLSRI